MLLFRSPPSNKKSIYLSTLQSIEGKKAKCIKLRGTKHMRTARKQLLASFHHISILFWFQSISKPSIRSIRRSFRSGTCGYPKNPGRSGLGGLTEKYPLLLSDLDGYFFVHPFAHTNSMQSLKITDLHMFFVCLGATPNLKKKKMRIFSVGQSTHVVVLVFRHWGFSKEWASNVSRYQWAHENKL